MAKITAILKDGTQKIIEGQTGWSLMEIARDNGIVEIEGVCGGSMACATCHMYIHPNWNQKLIETDNEKSIEENDMLDMAFDITDHSRLGCQIRMTEELDGIIIAVPGSKVRW